MKTYNTIQKLSEQHAQLCEYVYVIEADGEYQDNKLEVLSDILYGVLDKDDFKEAEQLISKLTDVIKVALDIVQGDFNKQVRQQNAALSERSRNALD